MRRAVLSVSNKNGVVALSRSLRDRGFELVSTGGTAKTIAEAGLPVTGVSDLTGFPELLGGRVKTLHPAVHAGILARRDRRDDLEAIAGLGIAPIDLVVVNLYPFEATARQPAIALERLLEEIDIGGPTLLRAAAKNFVSVVPIADPADYPALLEHLDARGGGALEFRAAMARKAFWHTAVYDRAIATALQDVRVVENRAVYVPASPVDALPPTIELTLRKTADLRYGENPHQAGAWYLATGAVESTPLTTLQGKALSFTNALDLDAALRIVLEFEAPAAVVIKHTNPCGVAVGASLDAAYRSARDADAQSAFGGIVGLNRTIDVETARSITSTFIEAVVAPRVDEAARDVLAAKRRMRVVVADWVTDRPVLADPGPRQGLDVRTVFGGVLAQQRDAVGEARAAWPGSGPNLRVVTTRSPSPEEWEALRFAWRVCAHVKSNAVVFAAGGRTVAIGAGQTSRVDAVKLAVTKAASRLTGAVAASDAFFPFRDGVDAIGMAGATAIVQPGGSVRDQEVIAAANEHELAMVFTGRRHFRH